MRAQSADGQNISRRHQRRDAKKSCRRADIADISASVDRFLLHGPRYIISKHEDSMQTAACADFRERDAS
jgi:hypothetical protein